MGRSYEFLIACQALHVSGPQGKPPQRARAEDLPEGPLSRGHVGEALGLCTCAQQVHARG